MRKELIILINISYKFLIKVLSINNIFVTINFPFYLQISFYISFKILIYNKE